MSTLIHERVALARDGRNPATIRRLPSGWVVIGDVQYLKGYCLLLADPVVEHLETLPMSKRIEFLRDVSILGEAVGRVTKGWRLNYSILGNRDHALHAHVHPRYLDEPDGLCFGPPWAYKTRPVVPLDLETAQPLMKSIGEALDDLCARYGVTCSPR